MIGALCFAWCWITVQQLETMSIGVNGHVRIGPPTTILDNPKIRHQVSLGLTSTLLFEIKADAHVRQSTARVDIRFEPWEEVFFVTVIHYDGRSEQHQLQSLEAMAKWFQTAPIGVAGSDWGASKLDVQVFFLPFSPDEREATREWFSKTLGGHPKRSATGLSDFVLASSIKRKAVLQYRWMVDLK